MVLVANQHEDLKDTLLYRQCNLTNILSKFSLVHQLYPTTPLLYITAPLLPTTLCYQSAGRTYKPNLMNIGTQIFVGLQTIGADLDIVSVYMYCRSSQNFEGAELEPGAVEEQISIKVYPKYFLRPPGGTLFAFENNLPVI